MIYGDVGQTFMYGAKGGEVYVLGNAAGRPLINAVGRPRVVINGTCLDFLAESFMAGDPLTGGGFVILNGIEFDEHGRIVPAGVALPGQQPVLAGLRRGDLHPRPAPARWSSASSTAACSRPLGDKDWRLIRAYLEENERLFGIQVEDLLTVDGELRDAAGGLPQGQRRQAVGAGRLGEEEMTRDRGNHRNRRASAAVWPAR